MKEITLAQVKRIVGKTWFDIDESDNFINLETREHGDVGSERAGKKDRIEASRLVAKLRKKLPADEYDITPDVCDEWVTITIPKDPIPESVRLRRRLMKRSQELQHAANELLAPINAEWTKGMKENRKPFHFHILDRSFGCLAPRYEATLLTTYGERLLYRNHPGCCPVFTDASTATAEAAKLLPRIQDLGLTFVSVKDSGFHEDLTYNYPPPRNVIERSGRVEYTFTMQS